MPKNVMKLLKPSPHRQRNDFDLSHRHVFDANFGELLPSTCIETVPGDNITLHASDLIRAIPFVSSPFLRAKQHLDVWFVPYRDLWHQFDAFVTMKSEPVSAAFKAAAYCPHTTQYQLHAAVSNTAQSPKDVVGRNLTDRSYYLLELLGYGDIKTKYGASNNTFAVNPFRLAAYNYIWYNEYRQQYYDDGGRLLASGSNIAKIFNFDDLGCDTKANALLTTSSVGGTERLQAMCQMRYRCWKKDLFTGVLPSTQFDVVSTVPGNIQTSVSVSGTATLSGSTGTDKAKHVFVDSSGVEVTSLPGYADGFGFNPGYLRSQIVSGTHTPYLLAHQNVTDSELGHGVQTWDQRIALDDDNYVSDVHTHIVSGTGTVSGSGTATGSSVFDVLSLRRAEAMQIWRENALRAGNHIKDNMMAHYGVASDFQDHRPTYLGSVSAPLNIGDIAATANSSTGINNTVGDIAGKGLSSLDEKVFKFHAKDFGVIMVMFSMLPEAEYDAAGIERTNQLLEREDFFTPEFENIGLEAVSEINIFPAGDGEPSNTFVYGYAPRYYGYKTKVDKVFGQFVGNGVFRSWSSQRTDVASVLGSLSSYTSLPLALLYVNPAIFNPNFTAAISVTPQFLVDLYFDVDAVRPMSVIGLPFS